MLKFQKISKNFKKIKKNSKKNKLYLYFNSLENCNKNKISNCFYEKKISRMQRI